MNHLQRLRWLGSNRWALAVLVSFVTVIACAQIAGIDQSPVDPNAPGTSDLCNTYCDTAIAACTDSASVYASREMCLGVCHELELAGKTGSTSDQTGDTIYCRLFYANQAQSTGEALTCPQAGPGGGGICGTDCEAYCVLMQQTCPTQFSDPSLFNNSLSICITQCDQLPVLDAGYNAQQQSGNSINCRLYHVSAASANPDAPAIHCPHASGMPPCADSTQ